MDEELAWQIRDLMWLVFSINPTSDSRGQLPYPNVVLSVALSPYSGTGVHRALGLFKAWQVQSIVSHCQNGLLHKDGVAALLTNAILYNPTLPSPVVERLLAMCFDGADEEEEIGFDALTTAMEALSGGEGGDKEDPHTQRNQLSH